MTAIAISNLYENARNRITAFEITLRICSFMIRVRVSSELQSLEVVQCQIQGQETGMYKAFSRSGCLGHTQEAPL